jgi:uncharacterized hydrophobic protein (TIGR00341 family)
VRLLQITIPAGKRETILRALDDEEVDYVVSDETSGRKYSAIAYVPLPNEAVQPILDALREAGLGDDAYTVILDANTVVSRRFEALKERYEESEEAEDRISRDELQAAAAQLAPSTATFIAMTVISALIATAGLLLDSPAVVVGSMVIAPLIGPAMAASVGTVINEQELFRRGVRLQAGGLLLAVVASALFAAVVKNAHLIPPIAEIFTVPEIQERVAPDVLSLIVALGSGAAGVIALTSGVSTALVGVMIAAALVPPTAVVGIGLAWGSPRTVSGALVLVLANFLSINFAALAVLWVMGYRPENWFRREEARSATLKRIASLGVALLVLSSLLAGVTYGTVRTANFEEETRATVDDVLADYDDLERLSITIEHEETFPFFRPERVTVTVGHPPGQETPQLAEQLAERIDRLSDPPFRDSQPITVEVRYVAVDVGSSERGSDPDPNPTAERTRPVDPARSHGTPPVIA